MNQREAHHNSADESSRPQGKVDRVFVIIKGNYILDSLA